MNYQLILNICHFQTKSLIINKMIYVLQVNNTAYYSSSRKLRNEAIRDLLTACLSITDTHENNNSKTRGE